MKKTLEEMEEQRGKIYCQMEELGDFRPGIISINYRKCGKKNCACYQKGHPGHGPQYLWNATRKGKSVAQNLRLGPELDKMKKETDIYKRFNSLCEELIDLNEKICRLRPVPEVEDEKDLTALKKKLQRSFFKRQRKKSKT